MSVGSPRGRSPHGHIPYPDLSGSVSHFQKVELGGRSHIRLGLVFWAPALVVIPSLSTKRASAAGTVLRVP